MARASLTALFCLLGGWYPASASIITMGQSTQHLLLTGLGPNKNGDGVSRVTWGDCTFDGTNTTCTLSGPFTGLGPGGTWDYVLVYPGNGLSPLNAITQPGSNLFSLSLSVGSLTFNFNESNGTSVIFNFSGSLLYVPGLTSCTVVSTCGVGDVGQTVGATITGPVTGTLDDTPKINNVISASAYGAFGSIAPATWIEIYGSLLAFTTRQWAGSDFQGNNAPTALSGTTVTVGGEPAFVDYVSPNQVNVQVPSTVALGSQQVALTTTVGGASAPFSVNVNATQPGLLAPPGPFNINGTQYAVALFSNREFDLPPGLVSGVASRRAVPGDTIILYGIGFGPVTPDNPAGVIEQNSSQLNAKVDISIGGVPAEVQYAGLTPGFVGLYQFNVVVPQIPASDATPLTFTLNGTAGTQTLDLFIGN